MWWTVGALAVVIVGVGLWRWATTPMRDRNLSLDEVAPLIDTLRYSCFGSVLVIEHQGSKKFMQLAQRSEVLGSEYILYGFPDAPWSRKYFEPLLLRLEGSGFPWSIRETNKAVVTRFAEVHLRGDRETVVADVRSLLDITARVLDLEPDARFTALVSGPTDHARWAWDNRELLEQQREKGGFRRWVAEKSLRSIEERRATRHGTPIEEDNDT